MASDGNIPTMELQPIYDTGICCMKCSPGAHGKTTGFAVANVVFGFFLTWEVPTWPILAQFWLCRPLSKFEVMNLTCKRYSYILINEQTKRFNECVLTNSNIDNHTTELYTIYILHMI